MKKVLFKGMLVALCLMHFTLSSMLFAGLPGKINYQGKLKENGELVNGTKKMEFRIYNAKTGGECKWYSGPQNVLINNGLFNYQLGSNKPLSDIEWNKSTYYLEIIIEETTILKPREELTGVAYSLSATRACVLTAPDGEPKDAVYVDDEGNVGIGTTSPTATVDINGDIRIRDESSIGNIHYFLANEYVPLWWGKSGGPHDTDVSAYVPVKAKGAVIKVIVASDSVDTSGSFVVADRLGNFSTLIHYFQNGFTSYGKDTWAGGVVFVPFYTGKKFKWKMQSNNNNPDTKVYSYGSLIGWF